MLSSHSWMNCLADRERGPHGRKKLIDVEYPSRSEVPWKTPSASSEHRKRQSTSALRCRPLRRCGCLVIHHRSTNFPAKCSTTDRSLMIGSQQGSDGLRQTWDS